MILGKPAENTFDKIILNFGTNGTPMVVLVLGLGNSMIVIHCHDS